MGTETLNAVPEFIESEQSKAQTRPRLRLVEQPPVGIAEHLTPAVVPVRHLQGALRFGYSACGIPEGSTTADLAAVTCQDCRQDALVALVTGLGGAERHERTADRRRKVYRFGFAKDAAAALADVGMGWTSAGHDTEMAAAMEYLERLHAQIGGVLSAVRS